MNITFTLLKELCEYADLDIISYSSRGMYGKKCLGIVTSKPIAMVAELIASAHHYENDNDVDDSGEYYGLCDELAHFVSDAKIDSMCNDQVVYWPSIEYED